MATTGCLLLILWIRHESMEDSDANSSITHCFDYCENSHLCHSGDDDLSVTEEHHLKVIQPVNTWTNIAYLMAGFWPLTRGVALPTVLFASVNLYLGIGSVMFHATMNEAWAAYDVAGMYAVFMVLVGHGFCAVCPWLAWRWWSALLVIAVAGTFPQVKSELDDVHIDSTNVLAACFVVMAFLKLSLIWRNRDRPLSRQLRLVVRAVSPGFLLGLGVLLRGLDANKKWCNPTSILQGHGIWHCLTASSILLTWNFLDDCQTGIVKGLPTFGDLQERKHEGKEEEEATSDDIANQNISDGTISESEDEVLDIENASTQSFETENRTVSV